ncbi:hypothetical protein HRbin20_00820 [bacterium HR20]|nr:hypothetical protein HRbin20_00820 [bacterium HR20]
MARSQLVALLLLTTSVAVPLCADGTYTGVVTGALCAAHGRKCPPNHDLRRSELPVVFEAQSKAIVLANLPQSFLAQWAGDSVRVTGTAVLDHVIVNAARFEVKRNKAWSAVFDNGDVIDDMGHRVPLSKAVETTTGKWVCPRCAEMMDQHHNHH